MFQVTVSAVVSSSVDSFGFICQDFEIFFFGLSENVEVLYQKQYLSYVGFLIHRCTFLTVFISIFFKKYKIFTAVRRHKWKNKQTNKQTIYHHRSKPNWANYLWDNWLNIFFFVIFMNQSFKLSQSNRLYNTVLQYIQLFLLQLYYRAVF